MLTVRFSQDKRDNKRAALAANDGPGADHAVSETPKGAAKPAWQKTSLPISAQKRAQKAAGKGGKRATPTVGKLARPAHQQAKRAADADGVSAATSKQPKLSRKDRKQSKVYAGAGVKPA